MGDFKKYIDKNREAFNQVDQPDLEGMWSKIKDVDASKGNINIVPFFKKMAIAVCFILLGGISVFFYQKEELSNKQFKASELYPELLDIELEYGESIAKQVSSIPFDSLDHKIFGDILNELNQLEKIHNETLNDVSQEVKNQKVVHALTRYYERKLQLLERLSKEFKRNKRYEKRNEKFM